MVLTLMLVAGYNGRVVDMKGVFLKEEFKKNKKDLKNTLQTKTHGYVS